MADGKIENKIVKTMDPRLDLTRGSKMVLEEGARLNNLVKRTATAPNNTLITFDNIDPGSPGFVIDRKIYVRVGYQISLAPRNAGAQLRINTPDEATSAQSIEALLSILGINQTFGFRAFPVAQSTRTLEMTLNGATFSERLNDYVEPLMRYDNDYIRCKTDYSMTPSLQDNFTDPKLYFSASMGGGFDPVANPAFAREGTKFAVNSDINVYQTYGGLETIIPRGSYLGTRLSSSSAVPNPFPANGRIIGALDLGGLVLNFVDSGADNVSQLDTVIIRSPENEQTIRVTEPIMLPISSFGGPDCRGFYGVNDLSISLVMDGSLADKVLCGTPLRFQQAVDANGFETAVVDLQLFPTVNVVSGELYYNRLTPKIYPSLPPSNLYEDMRVKTNDTILTVSFQANTLETRGQIVTINNLSVGSIPKRLYVYGFRSNKTYLDGDFYAKINSMTFEFNNQNTQFSGADSEQLYLMAKRNGLLMEYRQWSTYSGSVMCIDFARDVSLNDGDYPGRIGNFNFNMTLNMDFRRSIRDVAHANGEAELNVPHTIRTVVLEEGYAVIQNQICTRVGGLAQVNPVDIPLRIASKDQYWENIYGGKFIDDLKHIAHKGLSYAQKALPYVEKGAKAAVKYAPSVAKGIATVLPMLAAGAGMSEKEAMKIVDEYGVDGFIKMYGGSVEAGKMSLKKKAKGGKMTSKAEMASQF